MPDNSQETDRELSNNLQETDKELPNNLETLEEIEEVESNDNNQNISNEYKKPTLAHVREDKSREDESREDENRKNDFVVEKNDDDGEVHAAQNAMPPFRPWRELIDSLTENSEWKDRVCMTSNFSSLLSRRFKEALEIFKDHVLLHGKEKNIDSREEARNYFNNYTKEPRTSQALYATLLAIDARQQSAAPPDLHRYEQLVNGRRTYLGCPIPDDAPPRPDATAFWNEATHSWSSQNTTPKHSERHT